MDDDSDGPLDGADLDGESSVVSDFLSAPPVRAARQVPRRVPAAPDQQPRTSMPARAPPRPTSLSPGRASAVPASRPTSAAPRGPVAMAGAAPHSREAHLESVLCRLFERTRLPASQA